jgi:hypothetical protein
MSTSPSSELWHSISKSEYYSSLPWFRRFLAMLNWRPVIDYELREIEYEQSECGYENRKIEHEKRMNQLKSENARLAELNSKLDAILFSSSTSSSPPQNTPNSSEG